MKKYLPLVAVILLIAGTLLCLNFRTFKMLWYINSDQILIDNLHPLKMSVETAYDLNKLRLTPDERMLVEGYLKHRDPAWYKTMAEMHPEDKSFLAACIQDAGGDRVSETEYPALLSRFRKLDPDNALPDYCEALMLFRKAVKTDLVNNVPVYTVRDRALLEEAGKMFWTGMQKPFFNEYAGVIPERVIRLLQLKDDPFDHLRRYTILFGINVRLSHLRMLNWYLLHYAEILHREGRESESRAILCSGPQFLLQIMEHDLGALIEQFVDYRINRQYLECAKRLKNERAAALYQKAEDFFQQYRSIIPGYKNIKLHGGIFSNMMIPGIARRVPVLDEELTPERMVNYLVIDQLAMAGFCACILLLCGIFGMVALCKRSEPVTFSRKLWLQFIGYGMIVPLLIFLLYTHLDFLSGRMFCLRINLVRTMIGIALLFLLWIPLAVLVRKAAKGKPFAAYARAMLLPLTLLLFLTGIILRPMLDHEIRSYWQQETLFRGSRCPTLETRERDYLAGKLKTFMQKEKQCWYPADPRPIDPALKKRLLEVK